MSSSEMKYRCASCSAVNLRDVDALIVACPLCGRVCSAMDLTLVSSAKQPLSIAARSWSATQVGVFLTSLKLAHLVPRFAAAHIDGAALLAASPYDLFAEIATDNGQTIGGVNDVIAVISACAVLKDVEARTDCAAISAYVAAAAEYRRAMKQRVIAVAVPAIAHA